MVTPKTKIISEYEIIRLRDKMPLDELKKITNKCMEKFGYVGNREIYQTMGYVHAYNDKWYKP